MRQQNSWMQMQVFCFDNSIFVQINAVESNVNMRKFNGFLNSIDFIVFDFALVFPSVLLPSNILGSFKLLATIGYAATSGEINKFTWELDFIVKKYTYDIIARLRISSSINVYLKWMAAFRYK